MRQRWKVALHCLPLVLAGCTSTLFNVPEAASDEQLYATAFPYYAESCALSEIRKKPGSGVDVEGAGPGGHAILYLNGVCRVRDAGYPEIALCPDEAVPGGLVPGGGVGLSVNAHYSNANWVATEGRDFVFRGGLARGEQLTRARYDRTQADAKAMGILDGVKFHTTVFDDKPAGLSERDYMYEISVATDYATGFGRDRYCARVPLEREKMQEVVNYLNALQEPYRAGRREFEWDVLRNNCVHMIRNALATVGLWRASPTDRFWLVAAFDFPVPKNEFVNLMRRTNDMPIADPAALYKDNAARAVLLQQGWIATRPGGLAEAEPAVQRNALYDTALRLIFYDEPVFGNYQRHFDAIFSNPRYTDLRSNLVHFQNLYRNILAQRTPAAGAAEAAFQQRYYDHIEAEQAKLEQTLAALPGARR